MTEGSVYKARITTPLGSFEFEGSDSFVKERVDEIMGIIKNSPVTPQPIFKDPRNDHPTKQAKSGPRKILEEQPKFLPDLLTDQDKIQQLKKYFSDKSAQNHQDAFAVLALWMRENLNIQAVSIDHMWTAYKALNKKPARVLIQVFRDAKSTKGWFRTTDTPGFYSLTPLGESHVEHEMTVKPDSDKSS